ncbi:hypothetical protein E2C01_092074 [Portunus trituberculatus]|uniref:Uncharacterized protein n=1 Tax=Portunus trituberculatus TaxID=210409 RepID=A0A5B7JR30_PORTR|nr:hypothetical protein [Portunus trituberculatus]
MSACLRRDTNWRIEADAPVISPRVDEGFMLHRFLSRGLAGPWGRMGCFGIRGRGGGRMLCFVEVSVVVVVVVVQFEMCLVDYI